MYVTMSITNNDFFADVIIRTRILKRSTCNTCGETSAWLNMFQSNFKSTKCYATKYW